MRSIEETARALHDRFLTLARCRPARDPLAASCEELGLTSPQIHTMLWLGHDGPLPMGELARRLSVKDKTITGLVDRLERDGLARRGRDDADRRVVHVRLTARGAALARAIEEDVRETIVRLVGLLDANDRKALLRILDRLIDRLSEPREDA